MESVWGSQSSSVSEFHSLRLSSSPLHAPLLGGGRDGAGPGRAQQGFDRAMGNGALLKHMALIISNEPG